MRPPSRLLLKHVGNMGDHLFLVGALLEGIARASPSTAVTLVTAWGYKDRRGRWGKRNQDGFCIALMKENPHVHTLVHWSDLGCSLAARICVEEGRAFPTWDRAHFDDVKREYDAVAELEFGLEIEEDPLERLGTVVGLEHLALGPYPFYGTPNDWAAGRAVAERYPRPRVALLEGLQGTSMRGWDPHNVHMLEERFRTTLKIQPFWWGAQFTPLLRGRKLTLRENIAFLGNCDLAIGVLGAPLHFAAAAGTPTICLFGGQPYARAAPGHSFNRVPASSAEAGRVGGNPTVGDPTRHHITVFGPTCDEPCFLKRNIPCKNLHGEDRVTTGFESWQRPGRQSDKSCVAAIPVETVFAAAAEALERRNLLLKR